MNRPSVVSIALVLGLVVTARADEAFVPRFPHAALQTILEGDPERQSRRCLCQFGIGLRTGVPGFRMEELLAADDYGHHSYGGPAPSENNGQIYTCGAGFVDTTHLRAGVDWTAHLAVLLDKLTVAGGVVDYDDEGGGVRLVVRPAAHPLTREDLLRLAQRVAYERLIWHEVMSWYYHPPTHMFSEQQSAFSPEDPTSDFLGTEIGRLAMELVEASNLPFEDAVDKVMQRRLRELGAVASTDDTRRNFAGVDRHQDGPTTGAAWYDSDVEFWDPRYLFKRDVDVLTTVKAWRLPAGTAAGCERPTRGYLGKVPRVTVRGTRLTDLYEWQFTPERRFFALTEPGTDPRFVHAPQPDLVTNLTLQGAIDQLEIEMKDTLGDDFDEP